MNQYMTFQNIQFTHIYVCRVYKWIGLTEQTVTTGVTIPNVRMLGFVPYSTILRLLNERDALN